MKAVVDGDHYRLYVILMMMELLVMIYGPVSLRMAVSMLGWMTFLWFWQPVVLQTIEPQEIKEWRAGVLAV